LTSVITRRSLLFEKVISQNLVVSTFFGRSGLIYPTNWGACNSMSPETNPLAHAANIYFLTRKETSPISVNFPRDWFVQLGRVDFFYNISHCDSRQAKYITVGLAHQFDLGHCRNVVREIRHTNEPNMNTEIELLKPDGSDTAGIFTNATVAKLHSAEGSSVACNAGQTEPMPYFREDVSDAPDIPEMDNGVLDQRIAAIADAICGHQREATGHREAEKLCWRDIMPLLEEKGQRLKTPGKKSEKNLTAFLHRNNLNPSTFRSWRRRLKAEQAAAAGPEVIEPDEETSDTDGNEEPHEGEGERIEIETGPELLAQFAEKMLEVLTGKTIADNSTRITRAVAMVKDLQRAFEEGMLFRAAAPIDTTETNAFAGSASAIGYDAILQSEGKHQADLLSRSPVINPGEVSATQPVGPEPDETLTPSEVRENTSEHVAFTGPTLIAAVIEPPVLGSPTDAPEVATGIAPVSAPDWRNLLNHLMGKLEQYGDRLPVAVSTEMRAMRKLFEDQPAQQSTARATSAEGENTRGYRVEERTVTNASGVEYAVIRKGDKVPFGFYSTRREADSVCASLNRAPVASILDVSSLGGELWRGASA
jgi:hypothetical protein